MFIFGTQINIFLLKSESCLNLDSNTTTTLKAQKHSKEINEIVHVTSVVLVV